MPRLTNKDYLSQRQFLVDVWKASPGLFSVLSYNQQLDLHGFYAPYRDLTDTEAITHRRQVTADHPSLPNSAGKLYVRFFTHVQQVQERLQQQPPQLATSKAPTPRTGRRNIQVRALARPEPDLQKVAKALLEVARDMQAEQDRKGERAA